VRLLLLLLLLFCVCRRCCIVAAVPLLYVGLVLELCSGGTLKDAVTTGIFRLRRSSNTTAAAAVSLL
jgi:hypothetical protein